LSSSRQKLRTLAVLVLSLLLLPTLLAATNTLIVRAELKTQNIDSSSTNENVDLMYLAAHLEEFENQSVTTNGTVRFYASIYMFEDFWLQASNDAKVPVVTRFAGLSVPSNDSLIEISGTIEHSALEGGFYFLNASSWTTATIPEFSNTVILVLSLTIFSVLAAIVKVNSKRKRTIRIGC
jgi:hypothetical protein